MHEIGSDKARYEAMVAWKHRKVRHQQQQQQQQQQQGPCPGVPACFVVLPCLLW
jgi:hypothetical protein